MDGVCYTLLGIVRAYPRSPQDAALGRRASDAGHAASGAPFLGAQHPSPATAGNRRGRGPGHANVHTTARCHHFARMPRRAVRTARHLWRP